MFIVATAGMASTTYVQFIKGGLLIIFSSILVFMLLNKGIDVTPSKNYHKFITIEATVKDKAVVSINDKSYKISVQKSTAGIELVKLEKDGIYTWWKVQEEKGKTVLTEALSTTINPEGKKLYNGADQNGNQNKLKQNCLSIVNTKPEKLSITLPFF